MVIYILLILFAMTLSFLFSGSEMGLYTVNRLRLRSRTEIKWPGAKNLHNLIQHPQSSINTLLIGNNITHYIATISCAQLLISLNISKDADLYSTIILAPLLVVFTENTPKMLFLKEADALMYRLSFLLRCAQRIFTPLLILLDAIHAFLGHLTQTDMTGLKYHFTTEKLHSLLARSAEVGLVSDYQHEMVDNVLRVKEITLKQTLIPLEKVVMVPASACRNTVLEVFSKNNYSRLPVYADTRANIIGLINFIDIFNSQNDDIEKITRQPVYVNMNDSVAHTLYLLQKTSRQMAIILDSSGKAAGICTIKDLVEEITGDIYEW